METWKELIIKEQIKIILETNLGWDSKLEQLQKLLFIYNELEGGKENGS